MQTEPLGACSGPARREAPTPENSGGCAYCPADADGLDARLGEPTCADCASRPIVIPDGGDELTDRLTEEIKRTVRDVLDETAYRTPDERPIEDITTVDHCQACGLMPAPVILTNGDWECYNCGRDPNEAREIRSDGGLQLERQFHAVCVPCDWTGETRDSRSPAARDSQEHDVENHGGTITSELRPVSRELGDSG